MTLPRETKTNNRGAISDLDSTDQASSHLRACCLSSLSLYLILEQLLLESGHGGVDSRLLSRCKSMQLQLRRDHVGDILGVRRSSCTATIDEFRNVVNLCAIFVGDDGSLCGARVGSEHHAVLVDDATDRRAGLLGDRSFVACRSEEGIAEDTREGKTEARRAEQAEVSEERRGEASRFDRGGAEDRLSSALPAPAARCSTPGCAAGSSALFVLCLSVLLSAAVEDSVRAHRPAAVVEVECWIRQQLHTHGLTDGSRRGRGHLAGSAQKLAHREERRKGLSER